MKYLKIFAISLGALLLTSCSDDNEEFNSTAGITVDMADSQISVKEMDGQFYVPVKVEGTAARNGNIRVTVKVEGTGNNPAIPYEERNGVWSGNYILTSDIVNISPDQNEGFIEINPVDDYSVNEDRSLTVTIVSVEGATVGANKSTLVTLVDNDANPYERIQGTYKMQCVDSNGDIRTAKVKIKGVAETSPLYGQVLNISGMTAPFEAFAANGSSMQAVFETDPETGAPTMYLMMPQDIAECTYDVYASYPYPEFEGVKFRLWALDGPQLGQSYVPGVLSEDGTTISFPEDFEMYLYIANFDMSVQFTTAGVMGSISFTR